MYLFNWLEETLFSTPHRGFALVQKCLWIEDLSLNWLASESLQSFACMRSHALKSIFFLKSVQIYIKMRDVLKRMKNQFSNI